MNFNFTNNNLSGECICSGLGYAGDFLARCPKCGQMGWFETHLDNEKKPKSEKTEHEQ